MEPGATFGRYRILGVLGKGGMGQVYSAHDTVANRVVALKTLSPQLAHDEAFKERLRREASAASRMSNPHVVAIHEFGEVDGVLYLDMALVEGRNLGQLVRESRTGLDPHRAVALIAQVASALDAAHRIGLTHRDVKPSNVLVTADDFAYLIDFGLVRAAEDAGLTATGFAMGTVAYMSPEQLMGRVDGRSDVYSLACMLVECLTGQPPFAGDVRQRITAHRTAPPPAPSRLRPGLPAELDAVIARGMAKDPGARYRTAPEFAEAARAALLPMSGPVAQPGPTPVHRSAVPSVASMGPPPATPRPQQDWAPPPPPVPPRMPPPVPPAAPQGKPWWRRSGVLAGAAVLLVTLLVAVLVVALLPDDSDTTPSGPSAGSTKTTKPQAGAPSEPIEMGAQSKLPFEPFTAMSIGVDDRGKVFVGVIGSWILALPDGATANEEIRLSNGRAASAMAVDGDGTVYFVDLDSGDVFEMAPNSPTQDRLPFDSMDLTGGIAVGTDGTVYVSDPTRNKLFALEPGATRASELDVSNLNAPTHLAVGPDDTLYFVDGDLEVRALPKGDSESRRVLPSSNVGGLAVDTNGNLYVSSPAEKTVSRIDNGSGDPREVPFTGLDLPTALSVDDDGNVYVLDNMDYVIKLEAA